jgi:tetratricopeptide (TPR) repeat protein
VGLLTSAGPGLTVSLSGAPSPLDPVEVRGHTDSVGQRMSCPAFVGRLAELGVLQTAFDTVRAGGTGAVLLTGEAGIGKSRLVDEFVAGARRAGARVAKGACVPVDGGATPYGPFVALIDDLARQLDEPDASVLLGPLAAGLTSGVAVADGATSDRDLGQLPATPRPSLDEVTKTRLLELELASLRAVADRGPLVLVFEDVQWADSATADLLGFLIRNLSSAAVLFVCTCRSDEIGRDHRLHGWMREMRRAANVSLVPLEGLARPELEQLVDGILGHASQWTLVEAVWGRSQGNPFFAEELVAARERHDLPPELQAVILGRVAELSDPAQRVLRLAAVVGTSVDHDLLEAMAAGAIGASDSSAAIGTSDDPGGLDASGASPVEVAIEELVDGQILVVEPSRTGYRFRHALTREAVEGAILPGERRRLHRRAAVVLAEGRRAGRTGWPGTAELAAHWWAAEEWAEALVASVSAADAAAEVWAYPEVLAHLERALAALDQIGRTDPSAAERALMATGVSRAVLTGRAGDAAYLAGRGARSVELARQLIDQCTALGVAVDLAQAYVSLGRNAWLAGDVEAAFRAYRQAADLVPEEPPSAARARILAEEGRGLMLLSRFAEAIDRCGQAIEAARAVAARSEEGHALCTLASCRGALGFYDEGIELVRQSMAIDEEVRDPDALSRCYTNLSNLLMAYGRLAEVSALLYDSAAVGEALWGVRLNGAAGNAVEALVRLGRYDDARRLLGQVGEGTLSGACAPSPCFLPAPMAIRTGELDEAEEMLASAASIIGDFPDVQQQGTYLLLAAELALARADAATAYELAQRGLERMSGSDDDLHLRAGGPGRAGPG